MQRGHLRQDHRARVRRDVVELLLVAREHAQRLDRVLIAGLADVGERERRLERDLEILVRRVAEQALLRALVAEARERRRVPDLERRRRAGLELREQRLAAAAPIWPSASAA